MVLHSHRTVFTFRIWLDLLVVVLAFWNSILKIINSLKNYLHMATEITSFEKMEIVQVMPWAFVKIWWILFHEYDSEGISHPVTRVI